MTQLMGQLFLVATKSYIPPMSTIQKEDVDTEKLSSTALAMYNYAAVCTEGSRPVLYKSEMLEELEGSEEAAEGHVRQHAAKEYEKLEEKWKQADNQCDYVWTNEAMNILEDVYQRCFVETEVYKLYGRWNDPKWEEAMDDYETEVAANLQQYWENLSKTMAEDGRSTVNVNAVDRAAEKLEWMMFRRVLQREWRIPLICRSHFAHIVDYVSENGDAFRLVSHLCSIHDWKSVLYAGTHDGRRTRIQATSYDTVDSGYA